MGTTDNAFIKAFDEAHSLRPSSRVRRESAGVTAHANVVTVGAGSIGPAIVSEVYAGASTVRPVFVTNAAAYNADGTNVASKLRRAKVASTSDPHIVRRDASHTLPGSPHLSPTVFVAAASEAATASLTQQAAQSQARTIARHDPVDGEFASTSPVSAGQNQRRPQAQVAIERASSVDRVARVDSAVRAAPQWLPQWEVDRFAWPAICNSLNDKATSELADVVRPILHSSWQGKNVVAVTSFDKAAGGTTVSLCVARMAASFRLPVAVVDGDHEAAGLATALGIAFDRGWNERSPEIPLNEVAIASLQDRLVAVPINLLQRTAEFDTAAAVAMIDELASHFELVLVDTGPIYAAAHTWFASDLCQRIDTTIIVRNLRDTTMRQISDVCLRLANAGMQDVAVVENFSEPHGNQPIRRGNTSEFPRD